jgi:hypothetical protein
MLFDIIFISLGIFIFLWLTISAIAVIIALIGPPDLNDVTIEERNENDAVKSKELRRTKRFFGK